MFTMQGIVGFVAHAVKAIPKGSKTEVPCNSKVVKVMNLLFKDVNV